MMLCGYAPFEGDNNKEVFKRILSQDLEFDPEYWTTISEGAKDLITKMLKKDPKERISVNDALNHRWFAETRIEKSLIDKSIIEKLKDFKPP